MEACNFVRTIFLKSGRPLEVKVAVTTGPVVSGILGDVKPQFSLIGDTVTKVKHMCEAALPMQLTISEQTHHYLELYTNNYWFTPVTICLKEKHPEKAYTVSNLRGRLRVMQEKSAHAIKTFDGHLIKDDNRKATRKVSKGFVSDEESGEEGHSHTSHLLRERHQHDKDRELEDSDANHAVYDSMWDENSHNGAEKDMATAQ